MFYFCVLKKFLECIKHSSYWLHTGSRVDLMEIRVTLVSVVTTVLVCVDTLYDIA